MTKYYVTMTWHDWPEGGSYGTVVEALCYADAETLCRAEMASTYGHDIEEEVDPEDYDWHTVDCFEVDDFLKRHSEERNAKIAEALTALEDLLDRTDVELCSEAGGIIDYQTTEIRKLIA